MSMKVDVSDDSSKKFFFYPICKIYYLNNLMKDILGIIWKRRREGSSERERERNKKENKKKILKKYPIIFKIIMLSYFNQKKDKITIFLKFYKNNP